jgi:hypothetical protein
LRIFLLGEEAIPFPCGFGFAVIVVLRFLNLAPIGEEDALAAVVIGENDLGIV